jgi:hypothetical protein
MTSNPIPPRTDKHDNHPYCPFICADCDEYDICGEDEFLENPHNSF